MMILNSLIIENIRSYEHEETEFPKGVSLFEGDIGSGKSTILMSVEFALFGLGSQKAEALLAKKAETGYVILEFTAEDKRYEIRRTLLRKNSSIRQDPKKSWIKVDDVKEPLSPSELKHRVLQILKFNEPADPNAESRIFRYAIFTPQEAMKDVLYDSKRRLETIRKAFRIEDYSTAESNANAVLSEIRTKSAVLKARFSDISKLESEINESAKEISRLKSEISQKQDQEKILGAEKDKMKQGLEELRVKNDERIKLESERDALYEKIDTCKTQKKTHEQKLADCETRSIEINKELEELQEIKRPETTNSISDIISEINRYQRISNEKIRSESEKDSIQQDIARLKERFGEELYSEKKSMESTLDDLSQELERLTESAKEIKKEQEEARKQKTLNDIQKKTLKSEILKFSELGAACPTCKQVITDEHQHSLVGNLEEKVKRLAAELQPIVDLLFESDIKFKRVQSQIESCEQKIPHVRGIIPEIEEYGMKSAKCDRLDVEIKESREMLCDSEFKGRDPVEYLTRLKDKVVEFENMKEQIKQINKRNQDVEKLILDHRRGVDSTAFQISEGTVKLEELERVIGSFAESYESISDKENKVDLLEMEIRRVSNMSAEFSVELKNQTVKAKENESKISESRKYEAKYKKFEQFQRWLEEFFIPTISQIERQVLLSILQSFNETYTRWYSILVEDSSKESRIDEDFTPIVNQDGFDQEIEYLSGGEKTSIALAYRLTLNSLMRKETMQLESNLLILDEPTDGFSKNQLGKIREVLDELKSEQIVLVSHERDLEVYADNIFQVSKQDGVSKISRIT